MKLNIDSRKHCQFFGFTEYPEYPENESILIFHSCSTNLNIDIDDVMESFGAGYGDCDELHIGNTPRSIMTKAKHWGNHSWYTNFDPGKNDKLMILYRREPSHDYEMSGACAVLFKGEMHFFGGRKRVSMDRQHFVIEKHRSGRLAKMTKSEDLEIGFDSPSCSSFQMTGEHFPWFRTHVVILCFDLYHEMSCYSFDGKLTFIGNSTYEHYYGGLTKYKEGLLTVGGRWVAQKTEIMKMDENKNCSWSVVEPDFKFNRNSSIYSHSLVTIESSDINEEYVLLIGGISDRYRIMQNIFKFNGTWFPFGQLNKPRNSHNSIYWNEAVYVIGGRNDLIDDEKYKTMIEIWNMKDSPEHFKTIENWPELNDWLDPHLFIVSDSFFPDR